MDDNLFSDWMTPEEKQAAEIQFLELDRRQQEDPWRLWRIEVNIALANEGINIRWPDNDDDEMAYVVLQPIVTDEWIKDGEKVPYIHLRDLYDTGRRRDDDDFDPPPHPIATALYLKSVLYDKRYRLWQYEED
jgi:hypothetical protein